MPRPRKYPQELVDRGVRLAIESDRPVAHVAAELGLPENRLGPLAARSSESGGSGTRTWRDDIYSTSAESPLHLLIAPSQVDARRASTTDAVNVLLQRARPDPGTALMITSTIYVPYQFFIAAPLLIDAGLVDQLTKTTDTYKTSSGTIGHLTYTYTYNADGLQASVTDQNNNETTYTYDGLQRLTEAETQTGGTGTATRQYQYTYNGDGDLTQEALTGSAVTAATTSYAYNRLLHVEGG